MYVKLLLLRVIYGVEFRSAAIGHMVIQLDGEGVCAAGLYALVNVEYAQVLDQFRVYLKIVGLMNQC